MFEKLLSLIPYNPGLLQQMNFYGQRMREEAAIRRTGMIFIVLAFLIQFFAVLNPPQLTAAARRSSNDLVDCGISSAEDAYRHCMAGTPGEEYGSSQSSPERAQLIWPARHRLFRLAPENPTDRRQHKAHPCGYLAECPKPELRAQPIPRLRLAASSGRRHRCSES